MKVEITMTDDLGTELATFTLGKDEGEWNPESPEEMGQLTGEIESVWNIRREERDE